MKSINIKDSTANLQREWLKRNADDMQIYRRVERPKDTWFARRQREVAEGNTDKE
jgi:hypothetical protein